MKKLFLIVSLFVSSLVYADVDSTLDVSKLTQEQRAAIQLQIAQIAQKKSDPSSIAVSVREEASKWAELGKNVGTALVASAKEVGQGVNEFSQTPVGQVTTAIIVYKVIGSDILRLIFGTLLLVVGTAAAFYVYRSMPRYDIQYENIPRLGGLFISRKIKSFKINDDFKTGSIFVSAGLLVVSWLIGLQITIQ